MFSAEGGIKVTDKTADLKQMLAELSKLDVLVGIPDDADGRKDGKVSNAELAYIHSRGSPIRGIPAREFIEPSIEKPDNKEKIGEQLGKSIESALNKNLDQAKQDLDKAGQMAENMAKNWFTNPENNWPPLLPKTIEARARRKYRISKYKGAKSKKKYRMRLDAYLAFGEFKTLIDTDQMRKSITHVVREK